MPEEPNELENPETLLAEEAAKQAAQQDQATEPAPESTQEPAPEPEVKSALEIAKQLGIETDSYQSDEELLKGLYTQLQEAQPYAEYGRQVLPYDQQIRQVIESQGAEEKPEKTEEKPEWNPDDYFNEKWKRPTYDKAWEAFLTSGMITQDPNTGQFVPAEGYQASVPVNVLQGLNEYRNWQRTAIEQLLENPYKTTWEAIQEPLQRMIQEQVTQHLSQYDQTQSISNWEAQNAPILYEHDNSGQMVLDIYGNPKPTAYGEKFLNTVMELKNGGMTDPAKILEVAQRVVGQPPQGEADPTPEEASEQKKESFLDEARRKASHSPNAGGYAENNDIEPIVQSTRELDNMFIAAAKKAGIG